jgi:hypothetical protein
MFQAKVADLHNSNVLCHKRIHTFSRRTVSDKFDEIPSHCRERTSFREHKFHALRPSVRLSMRLQGQARIAKGICKTHYVTVEQTSYDMVERLLSQYNLVSLNFG